jgi:energy-coupling factor transporter ATP-binding protein EcfA2
MSGLAANGQMVEWMLWPRSSSRGHVSGPVETPGSSFRREPVSGLYRYAGVLIYSAWPLGGLPAAKAAVSNERTIAIGRLDVPPWEPCNHWVHHWPPERGGMSLAVSSDGHSFLLRFPGLADFVISAEGRQIDAWPDPTIGAETLDHLLLDQVLPRTLAQQGRLVLHAGAVRIDDQAVAFIGHTGSGKSTLTASFHSAGYPLLSDDALVLKTEEGVIRALPTYPSLRLWPHAIDKLFAQAPALAPMAHYSSKRRIIVKDVPAKAEHPLPLASLYILRSEGVNADAGLSVSRLSPGEACMAILGNSFQLDVTDRCGVLKTFVMASRIAEQVPVYSLVYPRDFARLAEVNEAILRRQSGVGVQNRGDLTRSDR